MLLKGLVLPILARLDGGWRATWLRVPFTAALLFAAPACLDSLSSLSAGSGAEPNANHTDPSLNQSGAAGMSGEPSSDAGSSGALDELSGSANGLAGGAGPASAAGASGAAGAAGSAGSLAAAGAPAVCVSAPEVCDGVDNDCDGVVDEGCPIALAWDAALKQTNLGDSQGGAEFSDTCAGDEVLAGVNVAMGAWVDLVQGVCKKLTLATTGKPYQYSIQLGAARALAAHPDSSASAHQDQLCPGNTMVVGLRIALRDYTPSGGTLTFVVPQLWLTCAEPVLKLDAKPPAIAWQSSTEIGPATGGYADQTEYFETDQLASPKVLVGLQGAAGSWLDRIGVATANVVVTLKAEK